MRGEVPPPPPPLQGVSTGRYHAGVVTNCEDCQRAVFNAGLTCGDLNFPLLYCPELHFSEFNSSVADMKNSVAVSGPHALHSFCTLC